MTKRSFRLSIAGALALLAALPALAQTPAATTAAASPLPVRSVTLFTSGVAYIERGGEVDGDATVPLVFRTAQINDILKSLVLLDEKGAVQPATYAARDPVGRTLQSFAVDVAGNLSRAELLNRLRGAGVTVETSRETLTGQIVGVEQKTETIGERTVTVETLTLLGERGLQSVRLDEARAIRLLDNRLDREFREALSVLASGSDDQRRQVTLHFDGNGRRQVRVGYVTEAPLWKISYRLLLSGVGEVVPSGKPYLQGWALVENTTDEDWQNIRLSLVSGRPVSFIQDLYQPLYLPRPVVGADVVASPYPQTHGAELEGGGAVDMPAPTGPAGDVPISLDLSNAPIRDALEQVFRTARVQYFIDPAVQGTVTVRFNNESFRRVLNALVRTANPSLSYVVENGIYIVRPRRTDLLGGISAGGGYPGGGAGIESSGRNAPASLSFARQSVIAQASGQSAGELFQYNITTPVLLPRRQAAMIPVIAGDIEAEKVSLYNADADPRFPLNAVRVRNTTRLHLKGGPMTLFDEGVYAGDAKMEDIPPGDSRLVSYAVDLGVEGERQAPGVTTTETAFSLRRGVLTVTRRERVETTYTLKSRADRARTVLVEHPFQPEYKLVQPAQATERTADRYRFAVAVAPNKSEKLTVVVERPLTQTIAVLDADRDSLAFTANRRDIPAALREALQEVVRRRRRVQELEARASGVQSEIGAIMQDQERIRRNMAALDKASALYKRYVAELDRQETRIQSLRAEAGRFRSEAAEADRQLDAFVDKLDIAAE